MTAICFSHAEVTTIHQHGFWLQCGEEELYLPFVEFPTFEAHVVMQAEYDAKNPAALARLLKNGVKLRTFSKDIMNGCYKAAEEVMKEEAAKNAKFKKVYEPWSRFRQDQNMWASVAEATMQQYLIGAGRK